MIAALVASASVWVAQLLGAPPLVPQLVVSDTACTTPGAAGCLQPGSGGAPATVVLTRRAAEDAVAAADTTPLHEVVHAYSIQAHGPLMDDSPPEQLAWEEAGAAAVALDLEPGWVRRVLGPGYTLADLDTRLRTTTYPEQVAWLRGMSAAACRDTPDSRCARYWRRAWITGDRRALLAQAMSVPLVEGSQ